MIAPNVILPFDGLNSAIPAGFTRETLLDNKYIKGTANGVNPGSTGGSATHSHTSPAHSHTLDNHTHTVTTTTFDSNQQSATMGGGAHQSDHYHTATPSVNSSTIQSVAVTYSSVSNDPPYYEVIFIKADGYRSIPTNGIVLSAQTTRNGLSFHTPSANRYLKGAGTGQNAGATGGSTTNSHTIGHTHTVAHTHSGVTGAPSVNNNKYTEGSNYSWAAVSHTHNVTLATSTPTSGSNSSIGSQSETVEPEYKTLNAFKNTGSPVIPEVGDIVLWLGSLASIPVGWNLCDGTNGTPDMRGKFLKIPSTASASTTGGSNTHSHGAQSHSHTIPSHTHTATIGNNNQSVSIAGSGAFDISQNHNHGVSSVSSVSGSLASANTSANSSSNEPEYRTVAFIQFEFPPVIPNPILMMMVDSPENV